MNETTASGAPRRRGQRVTRWTDRNGIPQLATEERVLTRVVSVELDPRPEYAAKPWRAVVEIRRHLPPHYLIANAAGHGESRDEAIAKTKRRAFGNRRKGYPPIENLGPLRERRPKEPSSVDG